ncbi:MAG: uroporphyrinogen-III C-methyltransferase [Myxococcales bacterium]|nr:uroporphyrinogen-III C-methyltransferase [Myxococcales bacterium]
MPGDNDHDHPLEPAARAGHCYLVGAGPGMPELLTVRGARLLAAADVVLRDVLVDAALLDGAHNDAVVRSVGRRGRVPDGKDERQQEIIDEMVSLARAGRSVVRLKGGDPFLFGRGGEEAQALRAAAIPFEVVPGVASPLGVTAYAGIPLTHRELASSVTFVTAVMRDGADFDWSELAKVRGTICVFMGMTRLGQVASSLIALGRSGDTPAAVCESVSLPAQRTVTGTLATIAALTKSARIGAPSLLIVGEVVRLREEMRWFDAQPLFGKRVLVTRPEHQRAATMRALRERGAAPLAFSTIAIEAAPQQAPIDDAVRSLARGDYALAAFTSENGAEWFLRAVQRSGADARIFGPTLIAAIGPGTAAQLARHGLRADLVPDTFIAERLARAIITRLATHSGARILLPRALVAPDTLPRLLRGAGMRVDVVPIYRTVSASIARRGELRELVPTLDAVLFTSSSTVEKLCELLGDDAALVLSHATLASIGPITTATAARLGLRVAVTATVSTSAGLIDALETHYANARS